MVLGLIIFNFVGSKIQGFVCCPANEVYVLFAVAGEVYSWGWKECVPSGKVIGDQNSGQSEDNDLYQGQNSFLTEQGNFF